MTSKVNGNVIFFLIFIPIVGGIVGYNYGYKSVMAMCAFFIGMYSYFNFFLNSTLSIKERSLANYKFNLVIYTIVSIIAFLLSYYYYGQSFALKPLLISIVLFIVQLFFILK